MYTNFLEKKMVMYKIDRSGGLSKNFPKQKCFFKGLKSKKGNFKLLHADLAVFNSNRFFVLVFLQNLYFQQL